MTKISFVCTVCGKEVPKSKYWDDWSILIGKICKDCQLNKIRSGKDDRD